MGPRPDDVTNAPKRDGGRLPSPLRVLLTPDLRIVEATDAYRRATLVWRDEIRGCRMFDVFPDNPDLPGADGVRNLRASLDRVLRSAKRHRMPLQRYDVRDRLSDGGAWVKKFWLPRNTPVFGSGSREITHILHEVADVSHLVALRATLEEETLILAEQQATVRRMSEDIRRRRRELGDVSRHLAAVLAGNESTETFLEKTRNQFRMPDEQTYCLPGQSAPETGMYSVFHRRGCNLPSQLLFIRVGQAFPPCRRCGDATLYSLRTRSH
jgi:hypothetical protein